MPTATAFWWVKTHKGRAQRRVAHCDLRPDGVDQFLFRHDALGVAQQVGEQPQRGGLDGDRLSAALELPAALVEHAIAEPKDQRRVGVRHGLR